MKHTNGTNTSYLLPLTPIFLFLATKHSKIFPGVASESDLQKWRMSKDRKSPSLSQMGPDSIKHKVSIRRSDLSLLNFSKKKKEERFSNSSFSSVAVLLAGQRVREILPRSHAHVEHGRKGSPGKPRIPQANFNRISLLIVGWIEFGNYRKVGLKSDGANLHANPHRLGILVEEGNIIELFRLLLINFTLSWDERKKKILIQGRAKKFLCPLISLLLFFFLLDTRQNYRSPRENF